MLDTLFSAIVARLTPDLPGVYVAAYPKIEKKITIPAALFDVTHFEPANFGNETFDCLAVCKVYCIVDPTLAGAEITVRNLAVTVAARIRQEDDFGYDVQSGAEILGVGPDDLNPELDGYLVWAVDFQIGITLGETVWAANPAVGVSVTQITIGGFGSIGITHSMPDPAAPVSSVEVSLPLQPKG